MDERANITRALQPARNGKDRLAPGDHRQARACKLEIDTRLYIDMQIAVILLFCVGKVRSAARHARYLSELPSIQRAPINIICPAGVECCRHHFHHSRCLRRRARCLKVRARCAAPALPPNSASSSSIHGALFAMVYYHSVHTLHID